MDRNVVSTLNETAEEGCLSPVVFDVAGTLVTRCKNATLLRAGNLTAVASGNGKWQQQRMH
jgi:hypothetical protein